MKSAHFIETHRLGRRRKSNPILIAIVSEGYGVEHQAFTIDHSLYGVRIRAVVPLSPREPIAVSRREGSWHKIPARVVWVRRPISSAECIAGLEFLSVN
jgi:hypothetical protein